MPIRHLVLALTLAASTLATAAPKVGQLEVVADLPIRPGNVAATPDGRVFVTVHPLDKPAGVQLIESTGKDSYRPWPSASLQSAPGQASLETIDTPIGIARDTRNRLWIVDMGQNVGVTRIWGFDIATGAVAAKITLPEDVAPKGSFVQDLAVDAERGWIYLADIASASLLAVTIDGKTARRFTGHPSLQPDPKAVMRVDGVATQFGGKPAAVAVNPITLSKDGATLYYGAMNGLAWYAVPTQLLREGSNGTIAAAVKQVGQKPVSDGAATDDAGNHFFTNLNDNSIDRLGSDGKLTTLVRDRRLSWSDSVQFGGASWLYISVNQLHKAPAFTGGADTGKPPYHIMRVWTGTPGTQERLTRR